MYREAVLVRQGLHGHSILPGIKNIPVAFPQFLPASVPFAPGPVLALSGRNIEISGLNVILQLFHQRGGKNRGRIDIFHSASLPVLVLAGSKAVLDQRLQLLHAKVTDSAGFAWSDTSLFFFLFLHIILTLIKKLL
ncbi:hypothetical protein CLOSTHATH_06214 [Hungatella hathewayi DSM 13479]|uniref:Uncharacterized protein n=1 Tax=Hungatella hathewayi DSM 13479 TaxID=566550 RepID=D3ARF8_9FIRM|nr:hypothetical protein CLOSTHATH_06214 [Hungatella hathewayi DSM 13479]